MFHASDYKAPEPSHWAKDWQECYQHFLAHLWERSHSEHTLLRYSSELTRFFNGTHKPPQVVTRADVAAYASRAALVGPTGAKSPSGPPAQPRTHNTRVAIIASFYKFACGYECADLSGKFSPLTERNPAMGIVPTRESPAHRTMTSEEFERFIGAIPRDGDVIHARDRAMFLALWWTCRRRSELCALTWASIERTTFIVNASTRATREGYKYSFRNKGGASILLSCLLRRHRQSLSTSTFQRESWSPIRLCSPASALVTADSCGIHFLDCQRWACICA